MQRELSRFLAIGLAGSVGCGPDAESMETRSSATESSTAEPISDFGEVGDGDGDGGPDEPDCFEAFVHAPASVVIDGLSAVPIDILDLEAELSFDAANISAHAQGVMTFRLGGTGGMPIFDLRQTPDTLLLDGRQLSLSALARHDFGFGQEFGFAILEVELEPCSEHQLEFAYALGIPDAPAAAGLSFAVAPARAYFDLFSSDLNPGRYLESWLPANMPWDRHPISLAVSVTAEVEHTLISNATVDEVAPHTWQLEFPPTTTAMDPMLLLLPSDEIASDTGEHQTSNGQSVPYSVFVNVAVETPVSVVTSNVLTALDTFVLGFGDYVHPAMTVYIYPADRSMEYAGGTTSSTSALTHELFHSWWARGISPATYADGWIDEAWTMFATTGQFSLAFNWDASPVQLFDPHPFARDTPDASYDSGMLFFAGVADRIGVEALRVAMLDFYMQAAPPASMTTAQLEQHLYCTTGELLEIRQAFHRFVYGLDGDAVPAPVGYCD